MAQVAAQASITIADVFAILRRRLTLILGVAAVVTVAGVLFIARMPDVYESSVTVYLDPGRMPRSLDRSGVTVPKLGTLVAAMSQEILSRENLRGVIDELDLYPLATTPIAADAEATAHEADAATATADLPEGWDERLAQASQIAHARKDIKIEVIKVAMEDFVSITCKARTADLSARLVNRVTDMLVSKNHDLRVKRARDVRSFVEEEVAKAWERLKEQEGLVFKFRDEHRGTLPENQPEIMAALNGVKGRTLARRHDLDEVRARRAMLEAKIANASGAQGDAGTLIATAPAPAARVIDPDLAALQTELRRLQVLDAELAVTWNNPEFYDRRLSRAKIAEVKRRISEVEAADAAAAATAAADLAGRAASTPSATTLTSSTVQASFPRNPGEEIVAAMIRRHAPPEQIRVVQDSGAEVAADLEREHALDREQRDDDADEAKIEARLAQISSTQEKLLVLQGQLDEATRVHKELLVDVWESQKLVGAEETLKGDSLHAVEAAEAPFFPAWPNRPLLAAAALLFGLALGGGTAYLLDLLAEGFYTRAQVEADLGVPVLCVLPRIPNPENLAAGELFVLVDDGGGAAENPALAIRSMADEAVARALREADEEHAADLEAESDGNENG